ncbi:MAG: hypothetical protein LAT68_07735 [Cyclobacteriaceae bacterium]|nr:hypothetical protein [Cyclobacteriaceae bacterium]MCH8516203.1 hypothetical protein [Cyclobacteriaceae bacterium]
MKIIFNVMSRIQKWVVIALFFLSFTVDAQNPETEKKKFINHFVEDQIFSLGFNWLLYTSVNGAEGSAYFNRLYRLPIGLEVDIPIYRNSNLWYLSLNLRLAGGKFYRRSEIREVEATHSSNFSNIYLGTEFSRVLELDKSSNLRLVANLNYVWINGRWSTGWAGARPDDIRLESVKSEQETYFSPGIGAAYILRANEIMAFELGLNYDVLLGDIPNSTVNVFDADNTLIESVTFSNELRHQLKLGLRVYFMQRTQKRPKSTGHTF